MRLKKREYTVLLGEKGGTNAARRFVSQLLLRGTGKTKIEGQFINECSFPYIRSLRFSVCGV